MEERDKAQESARKMQEAARKTQERARDTATEATRMAGQMASLGTETMVVWSGVTQNVARDLMELSSNATQETTRLLAELQQATVDSMSEMQHAALRWQTSWPEAFRDPMGWYQRALQESVDNMQRSFGLARRNSETVTRSFERMQGTAEDATRTLQETFKEAVTKMQEVHARSERLRVA